MNARDLLLEKLARLAGELELTDLDRVTRRNLDDIMQELMEVAQAA